MPNVRLGILDHERHRLIAGPYAAPAVEPGDQIYCALHGTVTVSGWSQSRQPWPTHGALHLRTSLVVSQELVRALRTESVIAVSYWWDVSVATVKRWKRVLGIGRTEGSERVCQLVVDSIAADERIREWRRQHPHTKDPAVRAKISRNSRGRALSKEHRRKLSEAAQRRVMAAAPEVRKAVAALMRHAKKCVAE